MCGNSKTGIIRFHAEGGNSMSSEKEYKFLINKEMFDRIGEKFFWNNVFSQINFYYVDKNKKVIQDDITIRIRGKAEGLKLQIKVHESAKGADHFSQEYEKEIKTIPYQIKSTSLQGMGEYTFPDVTLVGYLITERRICNQYNGIEICLDRNIYLNKEDYELEIEYNTCTIPENLFEVIRELNLDLEKTSKGKFGRFIDELYK